MYKFTASERFWKHFNKLTERQKERANKTFEIFKRNPFDSRLRAHKINSLSASYGKTVYAADVEADLRVVFYIEGNVVYTLDIGSHKIYRP